MASADEPVQQPQSPPEREWPGDFPDWLLVLAVVFSAALAVILPIYSPSLWTDHNLPSYVPFLVGAVLSVMALGHGIWVGVVLWHRHFPHTQWRLVRQRFFTGSVALLTLWAVATDNWGWTVLFAVLLAVRLAAGRSDITWQRLAWLERNVAYQGSLGVQFNVRRALEHPASRSYFVESHPNASDTQGAFEAWIESRCSELAPQQNPKLKDGWVSVDWVFDCYSVYKDGEPQFARVVFHEITLGPERGIWATEWDDVSLRLCILNGWLKLQVGRSQGDQIWADIAAVPLYAWVTVHKIPSMLMNFDLSLEANPRERFSANWRAERRQFTHHWRNYERYLVENGHDGSYYDSWFSGTAAEVWNREQDEWLCATGAEDISSTESRFSHLGKCVLIPHLMQVGFRGGTNRRDKAFDHVLRVWRDRSF